MSVLRRTALPLIGAASLIAGACSPPGGGPAPGLQYSETNCYMIYASSTLIVNDDSGTHTFDGWMPHTVWQNDSAPSGMVVDMSIDFSDPAHTVSPANVGVDGDCVVWFKADPALSGTDVIAYRMDGDDGSSATGYLTITNP